jgi:protein-tyrosine phosphatase
VKWGQIYRSGHLHKLTESDLGYICRLGIREIVDFRGPSEIRNEPDRQIPEVNYISLPIDIAGSDLREKIGRVIRGGVEMDMRVYMKDVNRQFVENYSHLFSRWLTGLARNPAWLPQIFHCTAGKDRTGFAAAIFLRTLGVPEEIVMADYLKTNSYTSELMEKTIRKVNRLSVLRSAGEILRPLLGADETYLRTAFDTIADRWGDFDSYLQGALGLTQSDVGSLKSRFLE